MSTLLSLPHPQALSIRAKALVFEDPVSQAVLGAVERVAPTEATVLITGETGTGKELIARHIHACSGRSGPFLAVNCGAFSESMIEAELFGHEAGAYTGAGHARQGWFEAAQHGTLFLDEVGDLPLSMQVKLLRVLQERQVVRLGSRKPVDVKVRLIAATNVDLALAVEAGRFRRDLYYRLNIATVHLPPLAQRPADIVALAHHFTQLYAHKLGLQRVRLGDDALQALKAHDWPGNIRELENVIHCALIVAKGEVVGAEALGLKRRSPAAAPGEEPVGNAARERLREVLAQLLGEGGPNLYDDVERELVLAAYQVCHRNQVHTAELLGLSRNVLRTLLKRHGQLVERGPRRAVALPVERAALHLTARAPTLA